MARQTYSRRSLIRNAVVSAGSACLTGATDANPAAAIPRRTARPAAPFRVWFAPHLFDRDLDLYANMTLDAGGWVDPRLADAVGKTTLNWVYGLNHPDAGGPEYWSEACSKAGRAFPRKSREPQFISAGIAVDEWVPPRRPENEKWLADGLRAGRKADPGVFIAIWTTDPTPLLLELGRDGTADLILVEGYTHSAADAGPGLTTSWESATRRCAALSEAGLEGKTVFCFGHITAKANAHGEHLSGAWLGEHAREIKQRFPKMPGVAFYQHAAEDTPEFRELVAECDRLAGELWPDRK